MIAQFIGEGELIPRWWGIAYRDFDRDTNVAYPIPLHFLVRWERDICYWLMRAGRPGYRERIEEAIYYKGILRGTANERGVTERLEKFAEDRGFVKGWDAAIRAQLERFDEYIETKRRESAQ